VRRNPIAGRIVKAVTAGLLLAFSFPPLHWPVLLPFGVAFLIWALQNRTISTRQAAYTGLLTGLVFYAITLRWLFNLFGPAAVSLLFIASAFPMLFSGLYVMLRQRMLRAPNWLLASLLWAGIEYFRSELFWLSFGWMGLGYGPIENGFFGGAASVIGSYGISFLIVALGASIAESPLPSRARSVYTLVISVFWLSLFVLPVLIPFQKPEPNNPISVRLVQSRAGEPEEAIRLSMSRNAVPVDVILWPEYSVLNDPTKDDRLWPLIESLARSQHAFLILGGKEKIESNSGEPYHNTAFVLDPTGKVIGKHYKNHTVHFITDGVRGTEAKPIDSGLGKLGVAICYDMDYPDIARKLVQSGADVFLVPNMDPEEWGDLQREQHRLMFQMRAAECGRWLARADVAGGTSVAAPNGREVERIDTSEPKAMEVIVGREVGKTLYIRGGWLFGPLCFWLSVALMAITVLRRAGKALTPTILG
jgi:apolipoprotein N-acyltransferase